MHRVHIGSIDGKQFTSKILEWCELQPEFSDQLKKIILSLELESHDEISKVMIKDQLPKVGLEELENDQGFKACIQQMLYAAIEITSILQTIAGDDLILNMSIAEFMEDNNVVNDLIEISKELPDDIRNKLHAIELTKTMGEEIWDLVKMKWEAKADCMDNVSNTMYRFISSIIISGFRNVKERPQVQAKNCNCRCHTWANHCQGYGSGDKNCCDAAHVKNDLWNARMNPDKKALLLALYKQQSADVHSESAINTWVKEMNIPDHITTVLLHEFWKEGLHAANFEDVTGGFDVEGNIRWTLKVLEEFL